MPEPLEALLTRVHATPHQGVLSFAGAGAQALAWLHGMGGSSRTLLEATDHYAAASLTQAAGFEPECYVSERVAIALAERAHERARALAPGAPVFGLGCTASIATDRPKRGEHRAFIAARDGFGTAVYALELTKGARTRQAEEALVSTLIVRAVAEACGLRVPTGTADADCRFDPAPGLQAFDSEQAAWVMAGPDGRLRTDAEPPPEALLSGSFNPLHRGHKELAAAAAEHLGRAVAFELSLTNVDKASISLFGARTRAAQFAAYAPLVLTRAPLFQQKADLFPGCVFVIGADTAARLVAPQFYGGEERMAEALKGLEDAQCRFLVAGRQSQENAECFLTLHDIEVPQSFRHLLGALPERAFRRDISSTALREAENVT